MPAEVWGLNPKVSVFRISFLGPRLPNIRAYYEKGPDPKKLIVLEGSAHAQFLFETDKGKRVLDEIIQFLSKP
jgi:hypothetical protein